MTTMIAELYDALLAAGSPEEKARKAAEAMAGYEAYGDRLARIEGDLGRIESDIADVKRGLADLGQRVSRVEGDVNLLKWMMGFTLALLVAVALKIFIH